jgi:hypothetical protein
MSTPLQRKAASKSLIYLLSIKTSYSKKGQIATNGLRTADRFNVGLRVLVVVKLITILFFFTRLVETETVCRKKLLQKKKMGYAEKNWVTGIHNRV